MMPILSALISRTLAGKKWDHLPKEEPSIETKMHLLALPLLSAGMLSDEEDPSPGPTPREVEPVLRRRFIHPHSSHLASSVS